MPLAPSRCRALLLERTGQRDRSRHEALLIRTTFRLVLALRDDELHVRVHVEADDHLVEGLRQADRLEVEAEEGLLKVSMLDLRKRIPPTWAVDSPQ